MATLSTAILEARCFQISNELANLSWHDKLLSKIRFSSYPALDSGSRHPGAAAIIPAVDHHRSSIDNWSWLSVFAGCDSVSLSEVVNRLLVADRHYSCTPGYAWLAKRACAHPGLIPVASFAARRNGETESFLVGLDRDLAAFQKSSS